VNAAGTRLAYVNSGPLDGTCADVEEAVVLDAETLTPVADPDLPRNVLFGQLFFNGDTLYATPENMERTSDGSCPTTGSAGLWRADGDEWEQVDPTGVMAARPLEGMTGDEPTGWLVVTEDEQGYVVPGSVEDLEVAEGDLGAIDTGSYAEALWATSTRSEVSRGGDEGGGGTGGGDPADGEPPSADVDGAIARYEEFLHALGEEDLETVCEIAGPVAELAEEDGFTCESGYTMVFGMITDEEQAALREATVDADLVEESDDGEVHIPVEAVVADVTFTEENLGSYTLRFQDGDWFIVG